MRGGGGATLGCGDAVPAAGVGIPVVIAGGAAAEPGAMPTSVRFAASFLMIIGGFVGMLRGGGGGTEEARDGAALFAFLPSPSKMSRSDVPLALLSLEGVSAAMFGVSC